MIKKISNILLIIGVIYLFLNIDLKKDVYHNIKKLKFNTYGKNQVTYKSKPINGIINEKVICSIQEENFETKAFYKNGYLTGKITFNTQKNGENNVIYKTLELDLKETTNNKTTGKAKLKTITEVEVIEENEYLITEEILDINGIYNISLLELTKFLFLDAKSKLDLDIKNEFLSRIITSDIKKTVISRNKIEDKSNKINKEKSFIEEYSFENNNIIGKYYKKDLDENLIESANYNDRGQLQGWRTLFDENEIIKESSYYTYGYLIIKEEYENGKIVSKEEFINSELNKVTTYDFNGKVKEVLFKRGNEWDIYRD